MPRSLDRFNFQYLSSRRWNTRLVSRSRTLPTAKIDGTGTRSPTYGLPVCADSFAHRLLGRRQSAIWNHRSAFLWVVPVIRPMLKAHINDTARTVRRNSVWVSRAEALPRYCSSLAIRCRRGLSSFAKQTLWKKWASGRCPLRRLSADLQARVGGQGLGPGAVISATLLKSERTSRLADRLQNFLRSR